MSIVYTLLHPVKMFVNGKLIFSLNLEQKTNAFYKDVLDNNNI